MINLRSKKVWDLDAINYFNNDFNKHVCVYDHEAVHSNSYIFTIPSYWVKYNDVTFWRF